MADARIARFKGRLRFFSRYLLDTAAAEEPVQGVQLSKEFYDERTVMGVIEQRQEQAMFSVQAVKAAFGAHYYVYGDALACFFAILARIDHISPGRNGVVGQRGGAK